MRKIMPKSVIIILLLLIVTIMIYPKQNKRQPEPKRLAAKFTFSEPSKELKEIYHPRALTIKDNFLFVADTGNRRIQVLEIRY